jgi:RND family efflux transporter MFP subunit
MNAVEPGTRALARLSRRHRQFALALAIVVLALLVAAALVATRPVLQPQKTERPLPAVRVLVAEPRDVPLIVTSQGTVEPRTEAALVPEVAGRIVWMSPAMHSGGHFEAGEELLRIDDTDYRNGVGSAEAALLRARAEAEYARFESERLQTLQSRDLTSRSQSENAMRARRVTESALQEAEVALARARSDLERTVIRAPFTGRVRNERLDVGQAVNRGDALATIYATDYVEVRLPIADRQLAYLDPEWLHGGAVAAEAAAPVQLTAEFGGRRLEWEGRIVRTEGEIDARSRMVHVIARVENPDTSEQPLLPVGLFVHAAIRGQVARGVIELPRAALRDGNRALVVDAEDRLYYRPVELLRAERDTVLVRTGLAAGERVCVSPLQLVVEGTRVAPVTDD